MLSRRALLAWPAAGAVAAASSRMSLAGPDMFASAWSEASHSAVRLIAGAADSGGDTLTAGLEFRLARNFKTYWRDPGDSGVPPTFDWSGSENCAAIDLLWPAPMRFEDGAGWSIGYGDGLILPVRIRPEKASENTALRLKIDYAVCETLCVPAQGLASLALSPAAKSPHAGRVAEAMAKTPLPLGVGAAAPSGLSIATVKLIDGKKPALAVYAAAPEGAALDLFVEGPKGSFFGKPMVEASSYPGKLRLVTPIEERAKGLTHWPLRLTLVSGSAAIEVDATIEAPAPR